ncbi:MAG: 2-amino-4-hydroxy-6-hydroxymethyldihydropteridine diphosphokinase [Waltera sp.]|uniref:2-amino-4-hydroxy-6- hydroxymethyldihydropteridine diphosphokinase n=1 Tax=Waltera sp. TaxID=2815806 RepID=UPI0039916AED
MRNENRKDQIRIEELEVYAHHGVYPEENEKGQHFYVNATLYTNTRPAGMADDLRLSTNYGEVCQFITEFMQQHTFQLIETVVEWTAYEVLQHFPLVQGLDLEIRKPEAPIPLPFGSVSVAIHREWHEAYIAVGSNMGDSRGHIAKALGQLEKHKDIQVTKVSGLLETLPYGGVEQENFVNGMFEIRTLLTPEELLRELHKIEASEGRERKIHWGPRTLDLDIIFYDDLIYSSEDLVIPHVDMENRYFVLKPLSELAPNFRHPITHKTVAQMLAELPVDLTEGSGA